MLKKQMNSMSPTKFRILLIVGLVLILVVSVAAFWLFRNQLEVYAKQVQSDNAAANVSTKDIAKLQELETKLEQDKVAVTRAKSIVADSKHYQYQDQIISDLNTYAKSAGVVITGYTFNTTDKPGAATGTGATTTTPGSIASPLAPPQPTAPGGPKTTTASIAIKTPVNYFAIMKFIHSIELNLTKMQISGISLSRLNDMQVQTNPLTIEVYIK